MKITPIEIRQKDFQKVFRGYEKDEVDAFLLSLSQEWERVMEENKELKKKLEYSEKEVNRLRDVESSLFKTLKTAEDTGAHMIDHATKTAELHMREAQMNAEAIMNEAKSKAKNILEEAEEKTREILEDVQEEAKSLRKEYNHILDQRENLLQELKNIANDTLEKVSRLAGKNKAINERAKEIKSVSVENKVEINEPEFKRPEAKEELKSSVINFPEAEKKDNGGSFFDSIG